MKTLVAIVMLSVSGVGCATICVKRVDPKVVHERSPIGQRFSLPVPAFLVTPTGDGGMKVERKDLPDPANTFAVDGWALFAKYSLNVETKNGILSEVKWAPDTSAVLSQALQSTGTATSEVLKARQATETSEQTAIRAARLEVAQAQVEFDVAKQVYGADSAEAKKGKVALEKAKEKLRYLRGEVTTSRVSNDALKIMSNDPEAGDRFIERWNTAPAPMLLVLHVDENGRPSLEPAQYEEDGAQIRVPIAGTKPEPSSPIPATEPKVAKGKEEIAVSIPAGGDIAVEIELSAAVIDARTVRLESVNTMNEHTERIVSLAVKKDEPKKLTLVVKRSLPKDKYRFVFDVNHEGSAQPKRLSVTIDVK